jgi:hypothetical protein
MSSKKSYVAPCREGKVPLTIFVEPEIRRFLKVAAASNDTTVGALIQEAIAAVLKRHGKAQR